MNKNIIEVNSFATKAGVEDEVCPLDYLLNFYPQFEGKTVLLDDELFGRILNSKYVSSCNQEILDGVGYAKQYVCVWDATEKFPETRLVIGSYGTAAEKKDKQGRWQVESGETNWHIIEKLEAADILQDGRIAYARDKEVGKDLLFLVAKEKAACAEKE